MGPDTEHHYPKRNRGRRHEDRQHRRINWSALGVLIGLAIALLTAVVSLSDRVTTLETQSRNDSQRMERVENKLDRLLERVK